jgi:hypothetical protein
MKTCLRFRPHLEHNWRSMYGSERCFDKWLWRRMKHILAIIHFVPKILLRKIQKRGVNALLCSAVVEGWRRANGLVPTFTWRDWGKRQGKSIKLSGLWVCKLPSTTQTSVASEVKSCFPTKYFHLNVCALLWNEACIEGCNFRSRHLIFPYCTRVCHVSFPREYERRYESDASFLSDSITAVIKKYISYIISYHRYIPYQLKLFFHEVSFIGNILFSIFMWNAICRCRKTPCWSVGDFTRAAFQLVFVSKMASSVGVFLGTKKVVVRMVLHRNSKEKEGDQYTPFSQLFPLGID